MTDPAGGYGWRAGPAGAAARAERAGQDEPPPIGVLLLPRALESFILRDQAEDLLTAPGVVAVEPARISYGAYLRLPVSVGDGLAATQARRLKLPGVPRVIVIFHPLQYPLARGLIAQHPDAELWYWQWDRFDAAYDANPRQRARLEDLHLAASLRASVNIVVTDALGQLLDEAAGAPQLVPLAADSFPSAPLTPVVAVSLGHLGHRTDWKLLRAVAAGMPELVLLLIGEWHEAESGHDEDFQACRAAPNLVWLGRRSDEEAARLIACADVGIVPFERSDFNDTGLPYRILKYARLGRRTVSRDLKGVRTWAEAVTTAETPEEWIAALRAHAGARMQPDAELREWALSQTAHQQNGPLWERLEALGIESGRLGSERVRDSERTPRESRRKRRARTPDSAG
ncbi:glycosyltransferase [Solirubrobacter sp. CPCC 204708]|uniref:Glycosyltransferase n=1 Tax=Solirubrobacter deserti TaxID=2282478 RepID=A0ABT4RK32_9ACTN|nr:glycosyltransferase [Solirubrobacter deserti]MBE2316880.1 glycosyltransferase [Solirubrobacter deserti]MDA0138903.1 glycosyltransferase [Solirubrobacter deserti]